MAEPREPKDDSHRVIEGQAPGAGRIADSLLGGGCAGVSCGCVAFTVLLAAAFVVPLILMILFGNTIHANGCLGKVLLLNLIQWAANGHGAPVEDVPCKSTKLFLNKYFALVQKQLCISGAILRLTGATKCEVINGSTLLRSRLVES